MSESRRNRRESGDLLFYFVRLQVARQRKFHDTNLRLDPVALGARKCWTGKLIAQLLGLVLKLQEMLVEGSLHGLPRSETGFGVLINAAILGYLG